ncbi:hypothetical protein BY458DRAFT_494608 [Sporodiniella umbellata]|nr:hypothetical protein BY458DRAFT_494608 [Sporodiniella umbellata]
MTRIQLKEEVHFKKLPKDQQAFENYYGMRISIIMNVYIERTKINKTFIVAIMHCVRKRMYKAEKFMQHSKKAILKKKTRVCRSKREKLYSFFEINPENNLKKVNMNRLKLHLTKKEAKNATLLANFKQKNSTGYVLVEIDYTRIVQLLTFDILEIALYEY